MLEEELCQGTSTLGFEPYHSIYSPQGLGHQKRPKMAEFARSTGRDFFLPVESESVTACPKNEFYR